MTLEMVFWDVQHGSATYIKTPNGRHIVQDLGTGSYGMGNREFSPLSHLKNVYKVEQLDEVIITHPHRDHISDILNFDGLSPRVLRRPRHLPKSDVMKDVRDEDRHLFDKYFEIDGIYTGTLAPSDNPELPNNNGGVKIECFCPRSCSTSNINNHSIVTVVSYAESKIILPGDNEPSSWNELLEIQDFKSAIKHADILLAPHHGRESGFCEELFEHFRPLLTVISDGRFCDASATDRYSNKSTGWNIFHRNGSKEERHCVTTRNDGVIVAKFGYNSENRPFINVTID